MSTEAMHAAWEAAETDQRLSTLERLILVRVAWRTPPGGDYEIRFKTMARECGASRNGVKAAVRNLERYGYFTAVAVTVRMGPRLLNRRAAGGHSMTPEPKAKGGQPVTPGGSASDPQRGQSVTPIKRKREKEGAQPRAAAGRRSPPDGGGVQPSPMRTGGACAAAGDVSALTALQADHIRRGASVVVGGEVVPAFSARMAQLQAALRVADGRADAMKGGAVCNT